MKKSLIVICLFFSLPIFAQQKEQIMEGEYTYYYEDDISPKEARIYAEKMAKQDVIERAFGTVISAFDKTDIRTGDNASKTEFFMHSESMLKGLWVEDIEAPFFPKPPMYDEEQKLWFITCHVKGRVRPLGNAAPEFEWHLLRNHKDERSEAKDGQFMKEDTLYMTFKAPCDGYLAVFLIDERGQAQCLLPHFSQQEGFYKISSRKKYTFFNQDNKDKMKWDKRALVLFTDRKKEVNFVYAIFSPNMFRVGKKLDESKDEKKFQDARGRFRSLPLEMSKEEFWKWLNTCMNNDEEMQRDVKVITISNQE